VIQELERYLTSSPIMVASEPSEPLLLYITTTTKVMSMALIGERREPQQLQAPKGASAGGSGSQDLDPTVGPGDKVADGSQLSEHTPGLETQDGSVHLKLNPGPKPQVG
jgi:hypothetical protein